MSLHTESGIQFDFDGALQVIRHFDPKITNCQMDGDHPWDKIDFRIQVSATHWIWLEVKSWDPSHIDKPFRDQALADFLSKLKTKELARELRDKFVGTTSYLAWSDNFARVKTEYVCLVEPPITSNSALLKNQMSKLNVDIPKDGWGVELGIAVVDLQRWNLTFPQFQASKSDPSIL